MAGSAPDALAPMDAGKAATIHKANRSAEDERCAKKMFMIRLRPTSRGYRDSVGWRFLSLDGKRADEDSSSRIVTLGEQEE